VGATGSVVMAALVPAIQGPGKKDVDARVKPGHDGKRVALRFVHESCWSRKENISH
jgi:hypothetical protein